MYCLSKDGLRMAEATGFGIEETLAPVKYIKNDVVTISTPGSTMHCINADNGYLMEAFEDESEAKHKLKEVMSALASGVKSFEF